MADSQYGNLLAIPYRVVIALSDLGFLFRQEIIWESRAPCPREFVVALTGVM